MDLLKLAVMHSKSVSGSNKNMPRKITVIGGSGFVGTNLCKQLSMKQEDFEIIDVKMSNRFPDRCKIADVRNIDSLRKTITGDVVVNLAAVHRDDVRDKSSYHLTNVLGAENVASVCTEKKIHKIVFTSSVAVYGLAGPGTDETGAINPISEYGCTKFQAEERLRIWNAVEKNSLIIVRPTVIFGEGNRGNVFNLLSHIASGKFIMVGRGENKKSMAYIGNVVAFLEACIATDQKYGVYNYSDTPDLTMNELVCRVRERLHNKNNVGPRLPYWLGLILGYAADLVSALSGRSLPVSSIRVKKFVSTTEFTSTKEKLEQFSAPFQLYDGIHRTLQSEFVSPDPAREIFYTE